MQINGTAGIVTGAASGLGRATAHLLAGAGSRLLLVDLNEERLKQEREALGGRHLARRTDISDAESVRRAITDGVEAFGALRFVVNCAGIPSSAKTVSRGVAHDLDLWRKIIDVNLTGSFNVMRLVAEKMLSNEPDENGERGCIINTSSVAAFDGQKGMAAYSASKAAIAGMILPVARDLAEHGIRCMAIAPGIFETELLADISEKGREALSQSVLFPKRMGAPVEFAEMVRSILINPYVNGTCYRLDGGARLGN
jgi:NAD(P)-dependent dehydrogenase (short-subunit alcohol dehydrogenase family)